MPNSNDIVFEAAAFAARAHHHQVRKDGRTPYFSHPVRVCLVVRQVFGFDDPRILAAALLHDTLEDTTTDFCLKELKQLLKGQTAPDETAALVIEPVLGEGGYVPPPRRFMQALRELCDHYGILLVADEVQSGFGRTGKWFGFEHFGIVPDVVAMAKGLASGLPLSALAASADLMAKWPPGVHGGTYGGNAVACAAAVATLRVMHDEHLIESSARMGSILVAGLRRLQEEHPAIGDVRGLGLMVATEFSTPQHEPWTERAKSAVKGAFDRGLLLLTCGVRGNVVRFIPALVVTADEIDTGVAAWRSTAARVLG